MEFVALTMRQLDYLARQDPYLEPIFKGVFASDQLPKVKDIQTRSAYVVNVYTRDKQCSHWLSIFVEKDRCEVFDSYGLPLHWYKPSPFVTWVFKHHQDVGSNVEQLQATDSNTCGQYAFFSCSQELEESRWKALFNLLNISVMLIMIKT